MRLKHEPNRSTRDGANGGARDAIRALGSAKAQYRNASILENRRVVFNIKGDEYRLVVAIAYRMQIVHVKFIGTHKQYDAIDAHTVEPS